MSGHGIARLVGLLGLLLRPSAPQALTELSPPQPNVQSGFGASVAVDGSTVIVAAPTDVEIEIVNGVPIPHPRWALHVFDAATGALVRTIPNPVPLPNNQTSYPQRLAADGGLIALIDSGTQQLLVIDTATGAVVRAKPVSGPASFVMEAGALLLGSASGVFLEDARTGQRLAAFDDPSGVASSGFGTSLALSPERVAVGAPCGRTGCSAGSSGSGAVYVFDAITGQPVQTLLNPVPVLGDGFGNGIKFWAGNLLVFTSFTEDSLPLSSQGFHLFDVDTGAVKITFPDYACAFDRLGNGMVFSSGQALSLLDTTGSLRGVLLAPPGSPDDLRPPDTLCAMGADGSVLAIGDSGVVRGSNPRVDPEHTIYGWAAVLGEGDFAPPPEPDCSGDLGAQLCEQTIVPMTVQLRSRKRPIAVTFPQMSVPGIKYQAVGLMARADGGGTTFIGATSTKKGKLKTDKTTSAKIKLTGAAWKQLKNDETLSLVVQIDVSQGQTPVARLTRPVTVVLEEKEGGGGGEEGLVAE